MPMNDFLDNLGAEQHRKIDKPKKVVITPQTYIDMNEEFIKDDIPFRANNLIDRVAELLEAKSVRYFSCSDRTTKHEKIVIEYNHENK